MLIKVLHNDGYYDYVKPVYLNYLIKEEKIISFYRKSGVAVLGLHKIRSHNQDDYVGHERRFNTLLARPKAYAH